MVCYADMESRCTGTGNLYNHTGLEKGSACLCFFGVRCRSRLFIGSHRAAFGPFVRMDTYLIRLRPGGQCRLFAPSTGDCPDRPVCVRPVSGGRAVRGRFRSRPVWASSCPDAGTTHVGKFARLLQGLFAIGFLLLLFAVPVRATEPPAAAQEILEESGLSTDVQNYDWNFGDLWDTVIEALSGEVTAPLKFAAQSLLYLVIACGVGLAAEGSSWKRCIDAISVLGFGAMGLSAMMDLIGRVGSTAAESQTYLVSFVPVYSAVLTLCGQTTGAAMYSGMFFSMSTFLSMAMERLLLPVMQIYFCFSVSAALWGNPGIEDAAKLFSRCLSWMLKACGTLFSFVLGLQGILAGNCDSAALRIGKSVLSGALPVVGDAAAAALESAVSTVRLLKGSLALAAILVMAAAFLPVLVHCTLYFLAFSISGILASASGQRQCGQICRLFADGSRLCGSILTLYFFMVFLSTLLLLLMGNGG